MYELAVRMLWHPADAEDATQEILVRIVTHLGSFRGESRFSTWAWRVAAKHLLTTRRSRAERERLTFDVFAQQLATGLEDGALAAAGADRALLAEEVEGNCGLVNASRPCRCARRIETAIRAGRFAPDRLLFATHPRRDADGALRRGIAEMERLHRTAEILRSNPKYAAPEAMVERVRAVLQSAGSQLLQ